jgi:hypothetical protein
MLEDYSSNKEIDNLDRCSRRDSLGDDPLCEVINDYYNMTIS